MDVSIFYDNDLAQLRFDENFEHLEEGLLFYSDYGTYSMNNLFKVRPFGMVKGSELTRKQAKHIKKKWIRWACELGNYTSLDDVKEIIDDFNYEADIKDLSQSDIEGFIDVHLFSRMCMNRVTYYDTLLECDLIRCNFNITEVRGYSQGDCVDVIYMLDNDFPMSKDASAMREMFTNLIFDSPVSGTVTIGDDEYYVSEYLKDQYVWDKDEFIEAIGKDISPSDKIKLAELVPEYLDYI